MGERRGEVLDAHRAASARAAIGSAGRCSAWLGWRSSAVSATRLRAWLPTRGCAVRRATPRPRLRESPTWRSSRSTHAACAPFRSGPGRGGSTPSSCSVSRPLGRRSSPSTSTSPRPAMPRTTRASPARSPTRSGSSSASFRQVQTLPQGGEIEIANLPLPSLAEPAAAVGSVLMPVDPDGVVRNAPRSNRIAGRETPSLAAAALDVALRAGHTRRARRAASHRLSPQLSSNRGALRRRRIGGSLRSPCSGRSGGLDWSHRRGVSGPVVDAASAGPARRLDSGAHLSLPRRRARWPADPGACTRRPSAGLAGRALVAGGRPRRHSPPAATARARCLGAGRGGSAASPGW